MSTKVKTGWLHDKNGDKFAPKTLISQVQTSDGTLLEDKLQVDLKTVKAEKAEDVKTLESTVNNKLDSSTASETFETKKDAQTKYDTIIDAKADWNQNDETAIDYIKNRTHYEDIIDGTIIPNATYLIGGTQGFTFEGEKYDFKMPIVGQTYQITYGDIVTTKIAYTKSEHEYFVYLGENYNEFIMRFNINSANAKVEMYIETASAGEKTISITGAYLDKIHQLDEKYIPTATDDDIIQMLIKAEMISPATDESNNLLTDENNSILVY